jgi:hypothetical protein
LLVSTDKTTVQLQSEVRPMKIASLSVT